MSVWHFPRNPFPLRLASLYESGPPMSALFRIGIDENGLGPRLGPLVVTAVLARVTEEGRAIAGQKPRGALADRLGDSKAMVAHGNIALGEAWARALGERMGKDLSSPDALLHALSLDTRDNLRSRCPSHIEAQCWNTDSEAFVSSPDLQKRITADLRRLQARGVDVVSVRTVILCTERLNRDRERGLSRFDSDLHAMERLILAMREEAGAEVEAVCGKVGGYSRYSNAFGPLGGRLHTVVEEGRARSAYRFPDLGEIAFVRDADANDALVAMASMVGKWVRELSMARITRHYSHLLGEELNASGYHDPVTRRFVEATSLVRRERQIDDLCFERARDEGTTEARPSK